VRGLDILKLQLFVLHNTDTISFPLFTSRILRYNKQQLIFTGVSPAPDRFPTFSKKIGRIFFLHLVVLEDGGCGAVQMAYFADPKEGAEGYPGPPSRPIPGEDQVLVHHLGSLLVVRERASVRVFEVCGRLCADMQTRLSTIYDNNTQICRRR